MKRNISYWQLFGFLFTGISGVLLHFLYEWTNESKLSALISGVNESTWEHMKLLFFPMLAYTFIEGMFLKDGFKNFYCIKLRGTLLGIILIPSIFYTLNGVFGKTPDWMNITIFFISAAAAYVHEAKLFKKAPLFCFGEGVSLYILLIWALLFTLFTFTPPKLPIFRDPVTMTYGVY